MVFLKVFFEKVDFENKKQTTKSMHNYPACLYIVDKSNSENSKSLFTLSVKKYVPSSKPYPSIIQMFVTYLIKDNALNDLCGKTLY